LVWGRNILFALNVYFNYLSIVDLGTRVKCLVGEVSVKLSKTQNKKWGGEVSPSNFLK
jgi:hypothetical protein